MTTLRGITWEHPRGLDSMVASARLYAQLTGVQVTWDHRSLQAFADATLDGLTAEYDLLVIDHPHVPKAAEAGWLAALDGRGFDCTLRSLAARSVGRSHASYSYCGHQYGLATDVAAQVSVSRPDLLTDPPLSWPEVLELARAGRVLWPAKPIDAYSSLVTVAAQQGHPPNVATGVFLEPEHAMEALDLLHRLAEAVPRWCLAANPIEVAEALSATDGYVYAPLLFGYTNYARQGFRSHRLRYLNIPAGPAGVSGSLLGGAGVAVSARSTHLDAALAFAFWVASGEVQSGVYFDAGGQPGHADAWEDDRLDTETFGFFRGTRDTLEGAYVRPGTPGYLEFQDTISPLVTASLAGTITDDQLVTAANTAAAQLLTEDIHADR